MPITNFEFPGVTLKQVFAETQYGTISTLGVCCVGSMYRLHRYDVASEAAMIDQSTTAYSAEAGLVDAAIPGRSEVLDETVDPTLSTHHLKVVNGAWSYPVANATGAVTVSEGLNKVLFAFAVKTGNGYAADAAFGTRGVKEGDPIILDGNQPASIGVGTTTYTSAGITESATYKWVNGSSVLYTTTAAPAVSAPVYDDEACEGESAGTVVSYTAPVTGKKVTATVVAILLGTSEKYDTVVVDKIGAITTGSNVAAKFCLTKFAALEEQGNTFHVDTVQDKVTVYAGLSMDLSADLGKSAGTATGTLQAGDLYLEYRERLNSYVNTLGVAGTTTDAEAIIGPAASENPLSLAVYFALQASAGTAVYFTAVKEETSAAYTEAMDFLNKYSEVYSIVPCTTDADVIKACSGAVTAVDEDENSKVRRSLWYGIDTDATPTLYTGRTTAVAAAGETLAYVTFEDYNVFVHTPVQEGDVVVNTGNNAEYKIVSTNYVNRANVKPATASTPAIVSGSDLQFSVKRTKPTSAQLIDTVAALQITNSLHCRCVWADDVLYNGEVISNFYLAAAAAGMRSGEECWRPLSNLSYSFFSVAESHGFSDSLLKRLGSYGIWIIANGPNGVPINKKAITTAVANDVNTDNESIVANADEIALALCHVGENMVGNSNISDTLLGLLSDSIGTLLYARTINATSDAVGNQLLSYSILRVYQDSSNLDQVYAEFECEPPKPFNKFNMTMRII